MTEKQRLYRQSLPLPKNTKGGILNKLNESFHKNPLRNDCIKCNGNNPFYSVRLNQDGRTFFIHGKDTDKCNEYRYVFFSYGFVVYRICFDARYLWNTQQVTEFIIWTFFKGDGVSKTKNIFDYGFEYQNLPKQELISKRNILEIVTRFNSWWYQYTSISTLLCVGSYDVPPKWVNLPEWKFFEPQFKANKEIWDSVTNLGRINEFQKVDLLITHINKRK